GALTVRQECLGWYELAYGRHHMQVARELSTLARIHRNQGDLARAETEVREALEIGRTHALADKPWFEMTQMDLGIVLNKRARFSEANAAFRDAAEFACGLDGPEGRNLRARALNWGSVSWRRRGPAAFEECEAAMREQICIRRELGADTRKELT